MKIVTVFTSIPQIINSTLHLPLKYKMPLAILDTQGKLTKRMNATESESIGMTVVIFSLGNNLTVMQLMVCFITLKQINHTMSVN